MKKIEKKFDAVKMMREAREQVSVDTANMSFAELKEYIRKRIKESKLKRIGS